MLSLLTIISMFVCSCSISFLKQSKSVGFIDTELIFYFIFFRWFYRKDAGNWANVASRVSTVSRLVSSDPIKFTLDLWSVYIVSSTSGFSDTERAWRQQLWPEPSWVEGSCVTQTTRNLLIVCNRSETSSMATLSSTGATIMSKFRHETLQITVLIQ